YQCEGILEEKEVFSQPDVPLLVDGGDFGSRVFSVTTKVLANREREFTTKSPLYTNNCWQIGFSCFI
ncbi:hypothetical protein, partial [Flavobacterium sp. TAB 87]|uniref:hypothetical protein n=1 Tax=Flavobacterium sp. TAB 87 TaxID=1729581 RepID=UPI001E6489F1